MGLLADLIDTVDRYLHRGQVSPARALGRIPAPAPVQAVMVPSAPLAALPPAAPPASDQPDIIGQLRSVLRTAFNTQIMPHLMQVYIEDATPDSKALARWQDYKSQASTMRIANGIADAGLALAAAVVGVAATPAAGALVAGIGAIPAAAQTAVVETQAAEIDRAIAPWQRPNNGVNAAFVLARVKGIYSYRGFTSAFWSPSGEIQTAQGANTDDLKDKFDDYIDGMLNDIQQYLKFDPLVNQYFPINAASEALDPKDRGYEHVPLRSTNTRQESMRADRIPVLPQYSAKCLDDIASNARKGGLANAQ